MNVDVVVDIGNSRIKWGRCTNKSVAGVATLPLDDPGEWDRQFSEWGLAESLSWAVVSVNPVRQDRFVEWLEEQHQRVVVLTSHTQLPLRVLVEKPDSVGMDRLLNAVAANERRLGKTVIIVDAGSAVTIDLVDPSGAFRGGAIVPGLRLMAQALHDHTALLPFVEVHKKPSYVGTSTVAAIESGIYYAVVGAIYLLIGGLSVDYLLPSMHIFTGGDAQMLRESVDTSDAIFWPEMTLEGLRISAEALP